MKAQISLHIYMGSMQCRPHIKEECLMPRGEPGKKEKGEGGGGGGVVHWGTRIRQSRDNEELEGHQE